MLQQEKNKWIEKPAESINQNIKPPQSKWAFKNRLKGRPAVKIRNHQVTRFCRFLNKKRKIAYIGLDFWAMHVKRYLTTWWYWMWSKNCEIFRLKPQLCDWCPYLNPYIFLDLLPSNSTLHLVVTFWRRQLSQKHARLRLLFFSFVTFSSAFNNKNIWATLQF